MLGHSLDVKLSVANLLPQSSGDGAVRLRASINVFKTKESILTISHIILEVGEGASVIFLIKQLILIISPAGPNKSPKVRPKGRQSWRITASFNDPKAKNWMQA